MTLKRVRGRWSSGRESRLGRCFSFHVVKKHCISCHRFNIGRFTLKNGSSPLSDACLSSESPANIIYINSAYFTAYPQFVNPPLTPYQPILKVKINSNPKKWKRKKEKNSRPCFPKIHMEKTVLFLCGPSRRIQETGVKYLYIWE